MKTELADKGVLVTGASGGIGGACARAFAAEGARVAVHFHSSEAQAQELAAEIGAAGVLSADLTDEGLSTGSSPRLAARPVGSTSARPSQASGLPRTCQSGSCRSHAGRRRCARI